MENFVEEAPKGKYARFEEILKYVKAPEHPNLKYFVFKNIILRNLYGVDIMKEAVEIAKLRLFLKLVATVDADYKKPNLGLEPLPDIDYNIRSGNTLIGYATEKEIENAFAGRLDFENDAEKAPLGRTVTIDEVGALTAFLCTSGSSGMTGQTIYVDAGAHIVA